MKASLVSDGGAKYRVAVLLLSPLFAALSKSELEAVITLIKDHSFTQLSDASNSFERPGAIAVTAALMTRHSNAPGMSEVSDILTLAGQYMDVNQVMPPEGSEWKPNLVESLLPDSANAAIDKLNDFFMGLMLPTSKEYSTSNPVDMIKDSSQTPGYVNSLYKTLESNIKGVEFTTSEEQTNPDGVNVGWTTALIALFGAGAIGAVSVTAIQALISALSADGETPSSIDRSTVTNLAKELGIDELAMAMAL
jgi:hypothetical protein